MLVSILTLLGALPLIQGFAPNTHTYTWRPNALLRQAHTHACTRRSKPVSVHSMVAPSSRPGEPVVTKGANSTADIHLVIAGTETQLAYENALRELGKAGDRGMPGFRKGAVMSPRMVLAQLGQEQVVKFACNVLLYGLQAKVDQVGLPTVGSARLVTPIEDIAKSFVPGKDLPLHVNVDLAPTVGYSSAYTGLAITVERPVPSPEQLEQVKKNLCERYVDHVEQTEEGYAAQMGDRLIVNMKGFEKNPDGSRGASLDSMASGKDAPVIMEAGRYVEGLVEGLVGIKLGETRDVDITFSGRQSMKQLEGKAAVFSVTCSKIESRVIPEFGPALASKIRENLSVEELEQNLMDAVQGNVKEKVTANRNQALEEALSRIVTVDVPEALLIDETRQRFAMMMSDFKKQGNTDEEIKKMITPENFEKYLEISREGTTKRVRVKLGLKDIAVREGITVNPLDVEDQLELVKAQEKEEVDTATTKQFIEEGLLKNQVLDWLGERAVITYVDVAMENAQV